jgi:cysteine-rich repeat protein
MSQPSHTRLFTVALAAFVGASAASAVRAQCVGDCNGDGRVAINELIVGVNIALGSSAIGTCAVFDGHHDGHVTINELIVGVNNATGSCPAPHTPTATVTGSTPTEPVETPTPTPTSGGETPTVPVTPMCGNGQIEPPETCDDGNTADGDNCPATCIIHTCQVTATTLDADVDIEPPAGLVLGALQVFVRYPDAAVSLPSSGSQSSVAISNLPDDAFSTSVNDLDYAVRVVSVGPDGLTLGDAGRFFTAAFTLCQGADRPPASAFACTVENATDVDGNNVTTQTTCAVVLP